MRVALARLELNRSRFVSIFTAWSRLRFFVPTPSCFDPSKGFVRSVPNDSPVSFLSVQMFRCGERRVHEQTSRLQRVFLSTVGAF